MPFELVHDVEVVDEAAVAVELAVSVGADGEVADLAMVELRAESVPHRE